MPTTAGDLCGKHIGQQIRFTLPTGNTAQGELRQLSYEGEGPLGTVAITYIPTQDEDNYLSAELVQSDAVMIVEES